MGGRKGHQRCCGTNSSGQRRRRCSARAKGPPRACEASPARGRADGGGALWEGAGLFVLTHITGSRSSGNRLSAPEVLCTQRVTHRLTFLRGLKGLGSAASIVAPGWRPLRVSPRFLDRPAAGKKSRLARCDGVTGASTERARRPPFPRRMDEGTISPPRRHLNRRRKDICNRDPARLGF